MALKCGIVGLPNVGKSTTFQALTNAKAEVANYPFCTIEPNQGSVIVPDERLSQLAKVVKTKVEIPTTVEIVDIAGLVKGASKGEGLGNQFLASIREVDAICHVVRCFDDGDVVHVDGRVDPIGDIETIDTELVLKDMESISKKYHSVEKLAKHDKDAKLKLPVLTRMKTWLEEGKPARQLELTKEEKAQLHEFQLLTQKPVIYVANVGEDQLPDGGEWVEKLREHADKENASVVVISSKFEYELAELPEEERVEYLESVGLSVPGKYNLIQKVYEVLGLITYFTAGEKEARAWTIRRGTLAPQAAGVIHTDFERGFIAVETIHCSDLIACGGYPEARTKGLLRLEGKSYEVKDGDVCNFRFNV